MVYGSKEVVNQFAFCICRYEERYGSKTLPWKKWIMAENLPDDTEETKIVRATFRAVVRKMIVGRQLRSGIAVTLLFTSGVARAQCALLLTDTTKTSFCRVL